jgi:hypothetical protein
MFRLLGIADLLSSLIIINFAGHMLSNDYTRRKCLTVKQIDTRRRASIHTPRHIALSQRNPSPHLLNTLHQS